MPLRAGRKIDVSWNDVTKLENSTKVTCNHCGTEISAKVERIKAHLDKCKQCVHDADSVGDVDNDIPPDVQDVCHSDSPQPGCSRDDERVRHVSETKKRKLQKSMDSYSVKTSSSEKEELDMKIASFFYANSIPFNAANSKQYQDMVSSLRPGYRGPSSDQIGGRLLDKMNCHIDTELAEQLGNSHNSILTIIMDGWSSVRNDPISATSLHTGSNCFLMETTDCGAEKKTSEACAEKMIAAIEFCQQNYGKQVIY